LKTWKSRPPAPMITMVRMSSILSLRGRQNPAVEAAEGGHDRAHRDQVAGPGTTHLTIARKGVPRAGAKGPQRETARPCALVERARPREAAVAAVAARPQPERRRLTALIASE